MMRVLIVVFLLVAGMSVLRPEKRIKPVAPGDPGIAASAAIKTPHASETQGAVSALWAQTRVRSRLENGENALRVRDRGLMAMTQTRGTKTELFEARRFARAMLAISASAAWRRAGERGWGWATALRSVAEVRLATGRQSDP